MIARVKVIKSWPLTPTTHAIRLEKPAGLDFLPVQFCGLEIMTSDGPEEYPMSLACSPTRPHLEFASRVSASPWKQAFVALKPGDDVEIDGAYGHFVLDPDHDAVLIGGGIGITPLKGMAEWAADTRWPREMRLVYSSRDATEIAYHDELAQLERENPRFRVVHTLTREPRDSDWPGRRGRIDRALLAEAATGLDDPTYYVCGKPLMVSDGVDLLLHMGVSRQRLTYELFSGYR